MICKICGRDNEEAAKFCVSCGKPLYEDLSGNDDSGYNDDFYIYGEEENSADLVIYPPKKHGTKILAAVLSALVFVAVAYGVCKAVDEHSTPMSVANEYIEALEDGDTEDLIETLPVQYQKIIKDNFVYFDKMDTQCSGFSEPEYRITGREKLDKYEVETRNEVANNFLTGAEKNGKSYGKVKYTKAYKITFEAVSGGGFLQSTTGSVVVCKIRGRWYVDPSSL